MSTAEATRCTIVMITRDRAARAIATVQRLLGDPEGWPVIVVDDGSVDGTAASLRSTFGQQVRVRSLAASRGAAARSVGVDLAASEYVAFSDDDSWWAPGSLRTAIDTMDGHSDVGLVAAAIVVEPKGHPDPTNELMARSPLGPGPAGPEVLGFLACGAVVRRTAYLEAGGFHPLLGIGGEEELLALDLRIAGWHLCYMDTVVAHHEPDVDDGGRTGRSARLLRNHLLVAWMRRPWRVALHESWRLVAAAPNDPVRWRALGSCLVQLPHALRARRVLPGTVERDVRRVETQRADPPPGPEGDSSHDNER